MGLGLAMLVVLGLPGNAWAGPNDPYFSVSSTSYSGQPRTFSVRIINNLENSKLSARISGSGLSSSLNCSPAGAVLGLGPWKCTLSGSYRLNPGSFSVTASASGNGKRSKSVTHSGSVSSRFGITSRTSPKEGESFTVRGRYDHISGQNDFRVRARVTSNGNVVGGQSGTACSASGGNFTCNLRSVVGAGSAYSVTVTESGPVTRSDSTSVAVVTTAAPAAPTFSGATSYAVEKQPQTISGDSNRSGLLIQVLVDAPAANRNWSSPTSSCTSGASGGWTCTLPKLDKGKHTIAARAIDPADPTKISAVSVRTTTVTQKAPAKPKPTATATPTQVAVPEPEVETPPVVTPPKSIAAPFDGLSGRYSELLLLLILGLAVTALARPGPLALASGGDSGTFATDEDAAAGYELALQRGIGIGDNSPSWRAFGHEATDFYSRTVPGVLHRHSPFLSRLATDGVDLRAIFGSLWWLFPLGGAALGIAAAGDTGGHAVPPSLGILIGVMVLASFDAFAGFVATALFTLLVISDVFTDKHGALTVLVVGFLWTALPLVATTIRPFRRPGHLSVKYSWDRIADLVIAALLCGWIAQKLAQTMDLFAGTDTGIPEHANQVGLVAIVAIAVRGLLTSAVDVWWPERLRQTEIQEDLPEPSTLAILSGIVIRTAVFGFLGHAFIGSCWQWFAGVALFALPDLLLVARDWLGLKWNLRVPLPSGLTEIFLIVVSCILLVTVFIGGADDQRTALRYAFLAAALVPAVLGGARVFRTEKKDREGSTWDLQLAGAGILLTTVILGLRGWNF
ncbi:hypothetical protein [Nocardioides marmoriginsengisoli]|uniref:hypothetical protein n=1 Tax=Nocardioides marmoriginsengisoli TaxID=661483 RepID=UPI0011CD438A|nr:hypothetical protein [Nocardioides marmoriginsengisoli]